ncbi:MAG: hypothetical protein ACEY3M_16180 [Wolbachia sp.]
MPTSKLSWIPVSGHWDDTLLDRNQCLGTGMTPKGLLLSWMETSVSYFHDTLTSSSRYLLAGSRDTANESRYDGSRWHDVGLLSFQSGIQKKG